MKLTHISNATCIYESQGYRILADPWLTDGIFYGTWFHAPPIRTTPADVAHVDALYISHLHEDHCDPETLKVFRREIPILVLQDRLSLTAKHLERMGFTNLIRMNDRDVCHIGPFEVTMFGPFAKHPLHACEIGNIIDSALILDDGTACILNANDNTLSLEAADSLRRDWLIDVAQLNSNAAGCYPATFDNLTHEEKLSERDRILNVQTQHLVDVAKVLGPRYVQPFAGQYALGGPSEHLNEYLAVWSDHKISGFLAAQGVRTVVLAEGESWSS